METDLYRINEPQVDIIQTSNVQTQTDTTYEQQVLQKLHALENSIHTLREDWRRDRETQNALMEKHTKTMLDNQKELMDKLFVRTKSLFKQNK